MAENWGLCVREGRMEGTERVGTQGFLTETQISFRCKYTAVL